MLMRARCARKTTQSFGWMRYKFGGDRSSCARPPLLRATSAFWALLFCGAPVNNAERVQQLLPVVSYLSEQHGRRIRGPLTRAFPLPDPQAHR